MQWPGGDDDREGREPADEDVYETEEQLTLADDDDALPWLESDEDYEQEEGFDARMILFALVGLLVVGGILLAAWYFLGKGSDPEMVPDGSTIEAPDEPYRTRPEDPGGMEVEGTGDLSYGVGEGEEVEGRISDQAPAPSIDRDQAGERESEPSGSGVGVQVGAYSDRAAAETGWNVLVNRFSVLQGVSHRIVTGTVDGNTVYRLQAIASDGDTADTLCRAIRNSGGDCQVKR